MSFVVYRAGSQIAPAPGAQAGISSRYSQAVTGPEPEKLEEEAEVERSDVRATQEMAVFASEFEVWFVAVEAEGLAPAVVPSDSVEVGTEIAREPAAVAVAGKERCCHW